MIRLMEDAYKRQQIKFVFHCRDGMALRHFLVVTRCVALIGTTQAVWEISVEEQLKWPTWRSYGERVRPIPLECCLFDSEQDAIEQTRRYLLMAIGHGRI